MADADTAAVRPAAGLRRTALFKRHLAMGAKLADFGGWEMPIEYPGGGVLREHEAVRTRVGIFDVGHLGKLAVTGAGAAAFVDQCLTNALEKIAPGRAQYTLCCDTGGGVVDDLIAYLRGDDDLLLVPNAANSAEVARRLAAAAPPGVTVTDRHDDLGVLAVQGPASEDVAAAAGLPVALPYMAFAETTWQGEPVIVCRTGYTGEHGYEVLAGPEATVELWDSLLAAIRQRDGLPCGLGARDTLRTEMGYPLHGNELSTEISAVQAEVGWAVGWGKPAFWGREALLAERARGPARVARGLLAAERGVPRPGMPLLAGDGRQVGLTTSGTFSPTLRQGIALALVDPRLPDGEELVVDVRGRRLACRLVRPPFVPSHVRD